MCLPSIGKQVYAEHWLPMQDRLGDQLELLFYLDFILRGREWIKRSDLYEDQLLPSRNGSDIQKTVRGLRVRRYSYSLCAGSLLILRQGRLHAENWSAHPRRSHHQEGTTRRTPDASRGRGSAKRQSCDGLTLGARHHAPKTRTS